LMDDNNADRVENKYRSTDISVDFLMDYCASGWWLRCDFTGTE